MLFTTIVGGSANVVDPFAVRDITLECQQQREKTILYIASMQL